MGMEKGSKINIGKTKVTLGLHRNK